jgi:sugar phosphate isomerase/epimerase
MERSLRGSGLEVFDVEVVRVTSGTVVADVLPALEFAGTLGARRLAVTSGTPAEHRAEDEADFLGRLEELCIAAEPYGVGIMLEFIPYRAISSLGEALEVVRKVGHPGLGVTLDALHFHRSGGEAGQIHLAEPELLACAQLCDAPAVAPADLPLEARYGRLFPGEGGLPLEEFVASLPTGLPVCVEVPARNHGGMSILDRAEKALRTARQLVPQTA